MALDGKVLNPPRLSNEKLDQILDAGEIGRAKDGASAWFLQDLPPVPEVDASGPIHAEWIAEVAAPQADLSRIGGAAAGDIEPQGFERAASPVWAELTAYELIEHHHSCGCAGCGFREEPAEAAGAETEISGETAGAAGTLQDMADFLLTGYWNTGYGDGTRSHNVTDAGIDANNGVLHYNLSGYSADADGVSAERAFLIREAFKLFEATLGIQFVETTSTDTGLVDFFFSDNSSGAYASHSYWNSGAWGSTMTYAQINVASSWSGGTSTYDDYTLQTIFHEIGHALGLGHQGPYNGSATYGVDNQFDNDNWQSSMMSYFSQTENTAVNADFEFLQTPMAVDWMALDELYGRQGYGVSNAFIEDTVWGFNTTVTSEVSDIWASWSDWGHRTASTIVDSGGVDTLDLSGYANNTVINLAPSDLGSTTPSTSDIGGRVGNLTIAAGTIIENAIGGAGSETFFGNAADNTLTGNGGDDTFHDSAGEDTYLGGDGTDYVIFSGAFADYAYAVVGDFLQVIDTVVDWVDSAVEWLTFSDQTLDWLTVANGVSGNTPPVAAADAFSVAEDQVLQGAGLLANDRDADGDALAVSSVEGVSVGAGGATVTLASGAIVTVFADGTFVYDQNGAFDSLNVGEQATDSFTYRATDGVSLSAPTTVTITIDGAFDNAAPIAADDAASLPENGTATIAVLANDGDANGDTLSVVAVNGAAVQVGVPVTLASGAVVTLNANGDFDYDPNGAFDALEDGQTATDSFTYTISDGQGGTDTAVVTATIEGVSPPIITENIVIDFEGAAPGPYFGDHGLVFSGLDVAASDALTGERVGAAGTDGSFAITTDGDDFDLNAMSLIALSGRQKVLIEAYDDGVVVGSVQVNVSARRPSDVTFDATFDSVDQIVVTGADSFLIDNIALTTRTPIDPNVNYAPVTENDTLATDEGAAALGNILANDSDPNGDELTLLSIEGSETGTVTLASGAVVTFSANGDVSYDPNGAFDSLYDGQEANDSFTYAVSDGNGGVTEGEVTVTIQGVGTPPAMSTVDFEDAVQIDPNTVSDDGFLFTDASLTSADPGVASGVVALASEGGSLTIDRADGASFDFESGVATLSGRGKETLTVEGYLDGVLRGSESFDLRANKETTINLSGTIFDNVDEVIVRSANGVILDDLSFLA